MTHYLIELLLWVALAYVFGCLLGWFFKNAFTPAPAPLMVQPKPPASRPVEIAPVVAAPPPAPVAVLPTGPMSRPKGITAARGAKADDLQRISGIGPKNEAILHNLGFYHFDQIAAWTRQEVAWVDDHLRFGGRIEREEWIRQARLLANGDEAEFAREFGTGGLKGEDGKTHPGSHTRKS